MFTRKRKTTTKAKGTKKHNGETLTDAKGTKTHNEETLSQAKGTVTPEEALARAARIKQHNEETLAQATPGDMLKFDRGIYCHWALYIGRELHCFVTTECCDASSEYIHVRSSV